MAEADKNLLVKFFLKPRKDETQSQAEGRPIFKDVEYVDIKIPGRRDAGACRPASDQDRKRFPDHYRAFKDRTDQEVTSGTPLVEWPQISRSQAEELAFFHVKTVEQLATMSDMQASKFMGLYGIREKAKDWLKIATQQKPLIDMNQKIREQRFEIEELQKTVADLMAKVEGRAETRKLTTKEKMLAEKKLLERASEQLGE
jgi:uncharacterized coiled-coil protein SlyX